MVTQRLVSALAGAAWLLGISGPVKALAQASSEEALSHSSGEAVRFRGQELFQVRASVGDLRPPERARAIEQRLSVIASGSSDVLDSVHVVERERSSDLLAADQLVLSVTDADANPLGRTRQQLAADYALRLRGALEEEFSGRSVRGVTTALTFSSLATLVLLLVWRLLAQGLLRAVGTVRGWKGTRIRAVHVQKVELLSAARMTATAVQLLIVLRWVLVAVAAVVYLQTVLGFFPWTRAAALQFRGYILGAVSSIVMAIVSYLPNLLYIALIVVAVRFVLRVSDYLFAAIGRGDVHLGAFHRDWATPTSKIVRFMILAFAVVIIFPYLPGAGSPAFQGVSIFFGVLLSLGSSSAIGNVVAGIVLTYMIPFRPGDRVKIGDTVGDIVESNLLVVRIRTIKNVEITIPNAAVLGGHIINFSTRVRDGGLILHTTVTIGYDAPWRTVHSLLVAAALKTDGILATPEPFVLQTSLDDYYVSYEVNAFTDQPNTMAVTYGLLHQNIQDGFAAEGVEIMSPHYRAVRDGNAVTIPAQHLPPNYVAPPFRVSMATDVAARGPES